MEARDDRNVPSTAPNSRRVRLECRECGVICERVVSPWRCLRSRHSCVYAFEDGQSTFFGCVHKVFSPEFDLACFGAEADRESSGHDPYGPVRAVRPPHPQCPVSVEQAYWSRDVLSACMNPAFLAEFSG